MDSKRKCVCCGEIKSRSELIKITKEHASGNIFVQPDSKTFGRSVYICRGKDCINMAYKKNKLNKLLRTEMVPDKDFLLSLIV